MDKFLGIMNNAEMTPAQRAQELVNLQAEVLKQASGKSSELWKATQDKWQEDIRKDPDVGGEKLEPVLAGITKLIDKYGSNELREVFDTTGAGNNVHVVKFLNAVAKELVVEGAPAVGSVARGARDHADIIYPNQGKQ